MDRLIKSSPNHYDFLMQKAKEAIRHDFDNCGNWIYRQRIIDDCISGEMPKEFIAELESDQNSEIILQRISSSQSRREFQDSVLPSNY